MKQYCIFVLAAALTLTAVGCNPTDGPLQEPEALPAGSKMDAVNFYIGPDYFDFSPAWGSDIHAFWREHTPEMRETFVVAEIVDTCKPDLSVGLVHYSLGGTIYRDAIWIRKVGETWYPSTRRAFSKYSSEFRNENGDLIEGCEATLDQVDTWVESSPRVWWGL